MLVPGFIMYQYITQTMTFGFS